MQQQEQNEAAQRKLKVSSNRKVHTRLIDSIILMEKEGLSCGGHQESLGDESFHSKLLKKFLKYLFAYDVTIHDHLEKVCKNHEEKQKSQTKKVKGWCSKLSNYTQNKVNDVIRKEIASELVKRIHECKVRAFIADTRLTLATMNSLE